MGVPHSDGVMLMPYLAGFGVLIFAGMSFFFALAESALFSLGKWQVRQLSEKSPVKGVVVASLLAEPQHLLATIVLGNTVSNASALAIALLAAPWGNWLLFLMLALLLALILVGCELVPKTLAMRSPELWALRVAKPMNLLKNLSRPFHQVAQKINSLILLTLVPRAFKPRPALSNEEYHELLELAYQQGTLGSSEREIILQIIGLEQQTAKDVMRPRSRMACISDELSVEEMIEAARKFKHSRLPMYDETPDTIVGVLNARALLLDPQIDLADAVEFPSFVPQSMNLLQLLRSLQKQQRGLAVVLDEYGGTAGVVTMQDIIERMVGRIRGERDAEGFVMEKVSEGRWRINGTMRLEDFRREFPALEEVPEVETMGGLMVARKEAVPATGESVVFSGLRLTALSADERRVREVMVEVLKK